jgi:hypothetical protein
MDAINFDTLPNAVDAINKKLDILLAELSAKPRQEGDYLMTVTELRSYLPETPAVQTVYDWTFKRRVPYEKYGKNLYFRKSAIDAWLANGRQMLSGMPPHCGIDRRR